MDLIRLEWPGDNCLRGLKGPDFPWGSLRKSQTVGYVTVGWITICLFLKYLPWKFMMILLGCCLKKKKHIFGFVWFDHDFGEGQHQALHGNHSVWKPGIPGWTAKWRENPWVLPGKWRFTIWESDWLTGCHGKIHFQNGKPSNFQKGPWLA
jgi:hypothetical protein